MIIPPSVPPRRRNFKRKQAYWIALREMVVHEDNLVNHRLTSLLSIEAFVIALFSFVQDKVLSSDDILPVVALGAEVLLLLVMVGVSLVCWIVGQNITGAYRQVDHIHATWIAKYPLEDGWKPFPIPGWWQFWRLFKPFVTEPVAVDRRVEFPPLRGSFQTRAISLFQTVCVIILAINLVAAVSCALIMSGIDPKDRNRSWILKTGKPAQVQLVAPSGDPQ